ncbi:MAG: glycosyl transferase family protein [Thiohalomonadales bacterium]
MQKDHPFANFVRILGKGKNGSRPLTEEEAAEAMTMILAGQVEPEQLGAFLMLMRVKEETAEEVAGFVRACRESFNIPRRHPNVQLDWSSYAGKRRQLPWFLLATFLLADHGTKVFMHGTSGHTAGRVYTKDVLNTFGIEPCRSLSAAIDELHHENFAYLDLEFLSPVLHRIIGLRPLLGLRSPVHTIARLLNPFNAPYLMQGIFHPGYQAVHQNAALLLGQPHLAVVKGDGGEIERNPDMECQVHSVHNGELSQTSWPAMFKQRHVKDATMDASRLKLLWQGDIEDEYASAAVIGTLAITLHMMGKADTFETAQSKAQQMWNERAKEKFGNAA